MIDFSFNPQAMIAAIPDALVGWMGVFIVTAVIIASTWLLDTLTMKNK